MFFLNWFLSTVTDSKKQISCNSPAARNQESESFCSSTSLIPLSWKALIIGMSSTGSGVRSFLLLCALLWKYFSISLPVGQRQCTLCEATRHHLTQTFPFPLSLYTVRLLVWDFFPGWPHFPGGVRHKGSREQRVRARANLLLLWLQLQQQQ